MVKRSAGDIVGPGAPSSTGGSSTSLGVTLLVASLVEVVAEGEFSPLLVVLGGLPASGKSTVARGLARRLGAAHVRVDTIEVAVDRAAGAAAETNSWALPPGYEIARDVAADQLRVGCSVVADSVNPLEISRDAWRAVGVGLGTPVLEVEVVCSDPIEHRRRAEERAIDVAGLARPSWEEILNRDYERWDRDHVVVDTALTSLDEAIARLAAAAG